MTQDITLRQNLQISISNNAREIVRMTNLTQNQLRIVTKMGSQLPTTLIVFQWQDDDNIIHKIDLSIRICKNISGCVFAQ